MTTESLAATARLVLNLDQQLPACCDALLQLDVLVNFGLLGLLVWEYVCWLTGVPPIDVFGLKAIGISVENLVQAAFAGGYRQAEQRVQCAAVTAGAVTSIQAEASTRMC